MSRYDALLLDFDGVLVDSEPIHWTCWRDVLARHGIELDWETYRRLCIGISDTATVEVFRSLAAGPVEFETLWAEYPEKKRLFRERVASAPLIAEPVRDLVAELHGRFRMAVVTSSARAEVEPMLVTGGVRQYFDALVCREDVTRHKPDPEPYRKAADLVGARAPLVVEDSAPGVESARAAGFAVIQVEAASLAGTLRAALAA